MCATYNITKSAMEVIKRELQRAADITDAIVAGKKSWADLFVKHTFFTSGYKYYITVTTASTTKEAHKIWSGYVESKVRVLVQGLERHPSIALAHAFNKGYERVHRCKNDEEVRQVQNGTLAHVVEVDAATPEIMKQEDAKEEIVKPEPEEKDIKRDPNGAPSTTADAGTDVYTTNHYIGLELNEGECPVGHDS